MSADTSIGGAWTGVLLPLSALVAALWAPAIVPAAPPARKCTDPCIAAARSAYKECVSSAGGAFTDALDGCLERDHECVEACRSQRQDCRDGTGIGAELVACDAELAATKAKCRNQFPLLSKRRQACLYRAEVSASRCRTRVRRRFRRALRDCRAAFTQCTGTCGPGGPPGGTGTCRAEGKAAFGAVLASCKQTFQVTVAGCLNKDSTCLQDCGDARDTCNAPAWATLDAALAACTAQEKTDVAACQVANPGGGTAFQQCVTTAQANASACRDAATQAAAPGFAPCTQQYLGCVHACPPA